MPQDREKSVALQEQVTGKVHWGADEDEILSWLETEKGISGDDAERLYHKALKARRTAIRGNAIIRLIFSAIGMAVAVGFVATQWAGGFVIIGYGSILLILLGFVSAGVFVQSLIHLTTGRTSGSVD